MTRPVHIRWQDGECVLDVPYTALHEWRGSVLSKRTSYVELFLKELSLPFLKVRETAHERLEHKLRTIASRNARKLKASRQSPANFFAGKTYECTLSQEDVVDVQELCQALNEEKREKEELKAKCEHLEEELEQVYDEMLEEIENLKKNVDVEKNNAQEIGRHLATLLEYEKKQGNETITRELQQLKEEYLKNKRETVAERNGMLNRGGKFHEVGERQQLRKLEILRSRAEKALWFVNSFGLSISGISLRAEDGSMVNLRKPERKKQTFQDLPEDEKANIDKVLFLLDRFCASDDLYNEIVQVSKSTYQFIFLQR